MSDFSTPTRSHDLLLIGGGAAALGLLVSMIRTGQAEECSVLMLDDSPGRCGRSGAYARTYDIPVRTLRDCLIGLPASIRDDAMLADAFAGLTDEDCRVPRPRVEAFLARLKRLVLNHMRRSGSLILRAARCDTLRHEDGLWRVDNQPGSDSRRVVLACGASEKKTAILAKLLECGLSPDQLEKVVRSSDALGKDRDTALQRIGAVQSRDVVILGRDQASAQAVRDQLQDWGRVMESVSVSTLSVADGDDRALTRALTESGLIITALGESPDFPRILIDGQVVKMGGPVAVDAHDRLVDHAGYLLPDAHAIGPALSGFEAAAYGTDVSQDLALWFTDGGEAVADPAPVMDRARVA
ncbi:MAG: hypothetical protein AAF926_07840 [Pseudomonadota bacterium]